MTDDDWEAIEDDCRRHIPETIKQAIDRHLATHPAPASASEPDMRAICEALGFDPTNHHNAAKCPYCRPASVATQPAEAVANWTPLPEDPQERAMFDGIVKRMGQGDVRLAIALALRTGSVAMPGGSLAEQFRIYANEIVKLRLPAAASAPEHTQAAVGEDLAIYQRIAENYHKDASASVAGAGEALDEADATTSEESDETLRALAASWKQTAYKIRTTPFAAIREANAYDDCADELFAALAARPVADGEAGSITKGTADETREEELEGLVAEMLELRDNWPGIRYSDELESRARAALARQAPAPLSQAVPEGSLSAKLLAQLETTQAPHHARYTQHERDFYVSGFEDAMEFVRAELRTVSQLQAVTEDARDGERLDAERYRWLRSTWWSLDSFLIRKTSDGNYWMSGTAMDAAIDTARAATSGSEGEGR